MITSYEYMGPSQDSWHFLSTNFGQINLLVGASSSGKTRFLNTLFNFSSSVSKGAPFRFGKWILEVSVGNNQYHWTYEGGDQSGTKMVIQRELLILNKPDGIKEVIVDRTQEKFKFQNMVLPRLHSDVPSVCILKEEPIIQPLYHVFSHMQRRKFHEAALNDAIALQNIPKVLSDNVTKAPTLEIIFSHEFTVSAKMFLLQKFFPSLYQSVIDFFVEVFPSVQKAQVKFLSNPNVPVSSGEPVPVFLVKESGISNWLPISELSSGMQKVLLIVTDILTLPGGSIYLIDEYENSLGINAIDFLPSFLLDHAGKNQFFITTHHPYLINNMPIRNWRVFTRKGSEVHITLGEELEKKFGKSKQKAFIQLINDPIYTEGVR